ncbi:MAG: dihydroxyacetone kinase subunit DhaK [Planctomycetes bacterium]|nr:dihydroxyacetone kinase subunit DhaK [Planctomycetota bacterium]
MKKFLNDPANLVSELLEGFALAHADKVRLTGSRLVARARVKPADRVALVTLGGSGHEPALSGYVGEGMLDVSVPGEIFAAPGPPRVLEALRLANRPAGVLLVVLNHEGDVLSSNVALELARKEGLKVRSVLTREDISAGTRADPSDRRGLVGCLLVYKMAGAAAEQGRSLEECLAVAEGVERDMATLAVALSPATHPATGQPISALAEDEMVIGMGQHGEAGGGSRRVLSADETADVMVEALVQDLDLTSGEEALALVNGVGATTLMEQYIVLRRVRRNLEERGIKLARSLAGSFLTVQEMGGFQLCLCRMNRERLALWDAPCHTPALSIR